MKGMRVFIVLLAVIFIGYRVNLGQSEVPIQENIQHAIEAVEEKVPELDMYSRYISEKSEGEAFLVVECDGIAKTINDIVTNIEFQNKYYAVYVGEQWEDHKVNWDWFFVSENFDDVLWYFAADSEVYTLIEWRESEHYRSELIEMKVETGLVGRFASCSPMQPRRRENGLYIYTSSGGKPTWSQLFL